MRTLIRPESLVILYTQGLTTCKYGVDKQVFYIKTIFVSHPIPPGCTEHIRMYGYWAPELSLAPKLAQSLAPCAQANRGPPRKTAMHHHATYYSSWLSGRKALNRYVLRNQEGYEIYHSISTWTANNYRIAVHLILNAPSPIPALWLHLYVQCYRDYGRRGNYSFKRQALLWNISIRQQ